jgi:hypothetical protein
MLCPVVAAAQTAPAASQLTRFWGLQLGDQVADGTRTETVEDRNQEELCLARTAHGDVRTMAGGRWPYARSAPGALSVNGRGPSGS